MSDSWSNLWSSLCHGPPSKIIEKCPDCARAKPAPSVEQLSKILLPQTISKIAETIQLVPHDRCQARSFCLGHCLRTAPTNESWSKREEMSQTITAAEQTVDVSHATGLRKDSVEVVQPVDVPLRHPCTVNGRVRRCVKVRGVR